MFFFGGGQGPDSCLLRMSLGKELCCWPFLPVGPENKHSIGPHCSPGNVHSVFPANHGLGELVRGERAIAFTAVISFQFAALFQEKLFNLIIGTLCQVLPRRKKPDHLPTPLLRALRMGPGAQLLFHKLTGFATSFNPTFALPQTLAQVPAVQMERMRQGALEERGSRARQERRNTNASRDAHRALRRMGIGWKVPFSYHILHAETGPIDVPYLHPNDLLKRLLQSAPEVLWGGFATQREGVQALESFWECYEKAHPSHPIFQEHRDSLGYTIPLVVHGDEGKGKRRANVAMVSLESPLGLHSVFNKKQRKMFGKCRLCSPQKLSQTDASNYDAMGTQPPSSSSTNMKGHSFLQHWPLWLCPATLNKDYPTLIAELMDVTVDALRSLFFEGVTLGNTTWCCAVIGQKGDLKWLGKVGRLVRGYEHKGQIRDIPMCFCCMAGANANLAYEDTSDCPGWWQTRFAQRPWSEASPSCLARLPFDREAPERILKHDVFHTLKVGLFRDFCGSVIMWMIAQGYFGEAGQVAEKLGSAHGSFRLWCTANQKTPSLRSFTKGFLSYKSAQSYPWVNSKGSDTMLIMGWIRTLTHVQQNDLKQESHRAFFQVMAQTADCGIKFFEIQYSHGLWLQQHCALLLHEHAASFLNGYNFLAASTLNTGFCGFAMKPKVHFFKHIDLEILESFKAGHRYVCNPMIWGCEQNEDLIGRCCKLFRDVGSRYTEKRVLECFLVKGSLLLKRFRRSRDGS